MAEPHPWFPSPKELLVLPDGVPSQGLEGAFLGHNPPWPAP